MPNSASKIQITKTPQFYESEIWRAGEDDLESFYVYGLLAANKTIFAFSEGRIERHDKSAHHIVLKKSTDNGETWSENQFVVTSRSGECFCNPTPIFDRINGNILLFYAQNHKNDESEIFLITSADNGRTWSAPQNLTALFDNNPYDWTLHLPGPGHGIQTREDRLIVQIWHRRPLSIAAVERNYGASVIFSDDAGGNWQTGGTIPLGSAQLNESRIVELAGGDLLLNARSGAFVTSPRYFSRSSDRGLSWSHPREVLSLKTAFATDSGLTNLHSNGKDLLILTRPNAADARRDLTVYVSGDEGKSWKNSKTIYKGFAGYSDAIVLPDGNIGVIYGRDLLDECADVEGNVRRTVFARFNSDWISG
jgi:Neuraminidase (sialidase)